MMFLSEVVHRIEAIQDHLSVLDKRVQSQKSTDESLSERISALAAAVDRNHRVLMKQIPDPKRLGALEDRLDALEETTDPPVITKQWEWQSYGTTIKVDVDTMTNECPVICPPGTFGWAFELMRRGRWLTYGEVVGLDDCTNVDDREARLLIPRRSATSGPYKFFINDEGELIAKGPLGKPFPMIVNSSLLNSKTWKLAD